jgi:predicted TIM-barrel fold metal-dependent hydrolase
MPLRRRDFLRSTLLTAAAVSTVTRPAAIAAAADAGAGVALVDTNVHLFQWPFRRLKYDRTAALAEKLRRHGVRQAWAGSFEALFSKDLTGVNTRLVEECRREGAGLFVPVGSVNPMWPDWEEELRRCHEIHRMHAIRLHPGYQGYSLGQPEFARLLEAATTRGLLVQIALELEDPRVHHPSFRFTPTPATPLVNRLRQVPAARVQLLGSWQWMRVAQSRALQELPNVWHDISNLEAVGAVGRVIDGTHWSLTGKVPVERLLFGSHAPYFPVEAALFRMFESPLSLTQMQAIMAANARRVLART